MYHSTGNIDIVSTEDFLPSTKEGLLRRTVDYKVTALVRLTLSENLFIWQENCMLSALTSVRIK